MGQRLAASKKQGAIAEVPFAVVCPGRINDAIDTKD